MTRPASEALGERRRAGLGAARLYLVTGARIAGEPLAELVSAALRGGVDVVQLREKSADDAAIVSSAIELRELCRQHGALFVVNDRPDLALASGADGVHLGQGDQPVEDVRGLVGGDMLIGLSTHSPAQIEQACATSADYLGVGPVYETATKPGTPAVGLELVRHAAEAADRPFFAIGGIEAGCVRAVARAGAGRVAVVRAIWEANDPSESALELRAAVVEAAPDGQPVGAQ